MYGHAHTEASARSNSFLTKKNQPLKTEAEHIYDFAL